MYALTRSDVGSYLTGSTMPKLTQGNLRRIPVPAPPLPEQRAIAHVLGTLDDKIELNRKMNATLDEIARTLFTSWFVDFDPVRAKAEGRQPAGMDAATTALFPDRFVDSELGPIPEGWNLQRIGDLVQVVKRTINPAQFPDEVFDHYSLPAFDNGRNPVKQVGSEIRSNKILIDRDAILVSKLNPHIPRVWLPDVSTNRRSICSTEFIVAQPAWANALPFSYSLFTSASFASMMASLVTGTTGSHQRVKPESLLSTLVPSPPEALVNRYSHVVQPMLDRILANRWQDAALAETRDALLPELLSGRVHVPDAERIMRERASG
jgi:type I restriction enzyme S subunit